MALKCPKCSTVLEVRLTAAPPMQADSFTGQPPSGADEEIPVSMTGEYLKMIDDEALESDFEIGFVHDQRERFKNYRDRIRMTQRQMKTLRKIATGA